MRPLCVTLVVFGILAVSYNARGISIVLDYTLDSYNENWFDPTDPQGMARRAAVDSAADFLSAIIVNDDWQPVSLVNESITFTDLAADRIYDLAGNQLIGTAEPDNAGYSYSSSSNSVDIVNRASAGPNEYVVYVGAFAFDSGTTAHAKASWDSSDRRNDAGSNGLEFNTWGGKIYFDTTRNWYTGSIPGVDPTTQYGWQDSNKQPANENPLDNWYWSTSSNSWKGFDLDSVDVAAVGTIDLYATASHELLHALGATASIIAQYAGVNTSGDFIGPHLVEEYGGPVPGDGGHFAENTQSIVWGSEDILSETLLDPNSRSGIRKYLTRLDAALLKDLGYQVLDSLATEGLPGDYNDDGFVNLADYTVWRDNLAGSVTLPNDPSPSQVTIEDLTLWRENFGAAAAGTTATQNVAEPTACVLLTLVGILYAMVSRARLPLRLLAA